MKDGGLTGEQEPLNLGLESLHQMMTTPTVFVLGAGASADFGFPVGYGLLQNVIDFRRDIPLRRYVLDAGWSAQDVDQFCEALYYSADASIDAFLEKRPDFMGVGKGCMAASLAACEQTPTIIRDPQNGIHWMKYLFRRMQGQSFEDFANNTVSFVTFNFDRVLEHFLCTALQNSWGLSEEDAGQILAKIPIVHLHGQMGLLPWQATTNVRPFNAALDGNTLRVAADGIKVVHEGVEDRKKQFDEAKALIAKAQRVYFLGVGASNVNMDRLDVLGLAEHKAFATERGLTQAEFGEVSNRYGHRLSFKRGFDCQQMISNFVQWP